MEISSGFHWIENLCRTCMRDESELEVTAGAEASHQWKCIFDTIYESSNIIECLSKAIPQMEVHADDKLPKKICDECLQQLLNSYRFQQMCLQSEKQMRQLLAKAQMEVKITIEQAHTEFVKSGNGKEYNGEAKSAAAAADPLQIAGTDRGVELCKNMEHINVNDFVKVEENDGDVSAITIKGLSIFDAYALDAEAQLKIECNSSEEREDGQQEQEDGGEEPKNLVCRFKCDICEMYYSKPETLFKHRRTHKGSDENANAMRYTCEMCDKTYGTKRTLTRHKKQRHYPAAGREEGTTKLLYTCEYCNKTLQQSSTLKDHIRTHTGEQPYLCSECGKAFKSSSNLKQHLLRHTGVKRYECPDCPKKFPCISDLASHKAVHRRIKPHICDICGNAFGKPYQLKKHKMYHNGEKPYKCEYCEMRFVCMDHQRRHMRTHTGEKPYKCKYCIRAFAQSNDLIKHLRTHLGDKVYRCELCPSAFRMASELRVHFAMHKGDDAETRERNLKALNEEEVKLREKLEQQEPEVSGVLEEEVAELKGDEAS